MRGQPEMGLDRLFGQPDVSMSLKDQALWNEEDRDGRWYPCWGNELFHHSQPQ